jgi:hypothetical protein
MRIYYDNRGRHRGTSMSGREWLFWNNSLTGMFVSIFLMIILFPLTIWYWLFTSKSLTSEVRLFLIARYSILWCVAGIAGTAHINAVNAGTAKVGTSNGCFSLTNLPNYPSGYQLPSSIPNSCSDTDMPRQACQTTDANDPANNTWWMRRG